MQIFGLEISRKKQAQPISVVAPFSEDGSTVVSTASAGIYAQVMELETRIKNENDLIRRYREVSQYPDCDSAVEDIINEAVVAENNTPAVALNLDDLKVSSGIKNKIIEEFRQVLSLLHFDEKGHDLFRSWYIDGRIYFHILVDETNPKNGIV